MNKYLSYICLSIIFIFCSCEDKDNFSSDSSLKLEFELDEISFDTVFTEMGSSTQRFKIYNRNKKSLSIQSVRLIHADKSGFKINIDGEMGSKLQNIDILKKDSLYAFIKIFVDPLNSDNPTIIRDTLQFLTNGNIQNICLEAIGQNVFKWHNKIIASDTILTDNRPFLIYDSLVINKDVKLTLEPGTKLFFRKNASLKIHGTIEAQGTVEKPIVMRGDRFDKIKGDILYDNVSGQWDGVHVYSESFNNHFDNVRIRSNATGLYFHESTPATLKATLNNTTVHNTSQSGVTAINCKINATNCLFTNSRTAALNIMGGEYEFLHCTIANYYRWANREKEALSITNISPSLKPLELVKCDFTNSIIYGSSKNELELKLFNTQNLNFQFTNCIIKSSEQSIPQFKNITWKEDPLFKDLDTEKKYVYDFSLQEGSPAIDKADLIAAVFAPLDIRGNSRLNDNNPDIGCYEKITE